MLEALIYIALGTALAIPLVAINVRVAPRLGLIDWPKARGVTERHIPIVGHSLVLLSTVILCILNQLYNLGGWFLTTALVMAVLGHMEDRKPWPPLEKILFQIICVATIVSLDHGLQEAVGHRYGAWGTVLAVVFIVVLMNAINLIDGIDGLAALVAVIGAIGFLALARSNIDSYPYFAFAGMMVGMLLPFLYFNIIRRNAFLGNTGGYFFGYVLAVMHLSLPLESLNAVNRLSISGLCFVIPFADMFTVMTIRLFMLRSPFQRDKGHLHHRLLQSHIPLYQILPIFAGIELASLALAVLINGNPGARASYLSLAVFGSLAGVVVFLILLVERASRRRTQVYFQKLDRGEPIYFLKYQVRGPRGSALSTWALARLQARISVELRVTDICFVDKPATLFITLRAVNEPLKGVSSRLEAIFSSEGIQATILDQGEFGRLARGKAKVSTA
jgi:UDP-GlcNAc:undecaprenyl-phosphate GlcNAc-1-phosphate transferase